MRVRLFRPLVILSLLAVSVPTVAQWADPRPKRRPNFHRTLLQGMLAIDPIPGMPQQPVRPVDRIKVKFKQAKTVVGLNRVGQLVSARTLPNMRHVKEIGKLGIQVYRVNAPADVARTVTALRALPEVLWVEPARKIDLLLSDPNDFYWSRVDTEHALFPEDNSWNYQWQHEFIQSKAAWEVWPNTYYTSATKPTNPVKVAILDTGLDLDHPDFKNVGGASVDALLGGQVDLANARNFFNGMDNPDPLNPWDDFVHGSHVAGIVAAATNNTVGIGALGYPSQILPIKVTEETGDGDDIDVTEAMIWAVDHGALIINMSLALNGGFSQGLQDAVNYAWDHNVLVVAAAGNDGTDFVRRYPAACNKVLAVAATTFASPNTIPPYESYASYTTFGTQVGIAAPGGDASYFNGGIFGLVPELNTLIWSTTPTYDTPLSLAGIVELDYGYLNGTSMASPHVAALAALYAGKNNMSQSTTDAPRQIIKAIQRGADNLAGRADGGYTIFLGHGRINALATISDAFGDGRDSLTPGCIVGQATYFGTPILNAAITAKKTGSTRTYSASSKEDGTYRLINLAAGEYTVTSKWFGLTKQKVVTVEAGCDVWATDFEMDASGIAVTVSPHTATVLLGGTQQFSGTVTGAANGGVLWSVTNGPGSVDSTGLYTAPNSTTLPATAEVQAASVVDPTKFDVAQVTIKANTQIAVMSLPGRSGSPVELSATLTRTPDGAGVANKIATFKVDGAAVGTSVTASSGLVTLVYNIPAGAGPGTKTIEVSFAGDAGYNSSVNTGTLTLDPVPTISSISPKTANAGASAFTLTVNGANFLTDSVVRWNGSNRTTTYVNSGKLTASISAADVAASGFAGVTVFNAAPGGGLSNTMIFNIGLPALTVSAVYSRVGAEIHCQVTVKNTTSATVNGVNINSSTLQNITTAGAQVNTTSTLPVNLGSISGGSQVITTLKFPGTVGVAGQTARLRVNGAYTGGSFGSSIVKVLP